MPKYMTTDPISDMLTRLRNATKARVYTVEMPLSKMKFAIAKILEDKGYLENVAASGEGKDAVLRMSLGRDASGNPKVSELVRVSRPGRRVYVKADDIRAVRSGFGLAIVSTPNGVMTAQEAKKRRLGGELICEIF